ncbi:MAG TPA: uroporphyrinogen-III synthase [Nocardioidaceae bacterium]|nr:uroporphyrinogen-III synthase [Nocardioidaceae bacterium]
MKGYRVGITSARKIEELAGLLERRGATVESAPVLSIGTGGIDEESLKAATKAVIESQVDVFVATTGVGIRGWFEAAQSWGLLDDLLAVLKGSEILARGPKSVGALRQYGLRELWSPESESMDEVLSHLRGRSVSGRRIVVQEHGLSLSMSAEALRVQGADVEIVSVYRCEPAGDLAPVFKLVEKIADRELDAVTFTSAPAVTTLMEVATASGRRERVVDAFSDGVLATCVGPVTAAAFEPFGVPTVQPERARLGPMVRALEDELRKRNEGTAITVGTRRLLIRGGRVFVDGIEVRVSGAPLSILLALTDRPGVVLSRKQLMAHLPSGQASSEHAVEMAVARLRSAIGPGLVQTVVKRGYRVPAP